MDKRTSWMTNEMDDWVREGFISDEQAVKIKQYYKTREPDRSNNIYLGFGVFGVILICIGIISIFAFNWENLSRLTKALVSLIPLIITQCILLYSQQSNRSRVWIELSSVSIGISLGIAISLISQAYQISGDFSGFMTLWMILILPLIYLVRSYFLSFLYIALSVAWASYTHSVGETTIPFWVFGGLILPFYISVIRSSRNSFESKLLSYALTIWSIVSLGVVLQKQVPGLWTMCYAALVWCLYQVGVRYFGTRFESFFSNPYKTAGLLGTIILSCMYSFNWPWNRVGLGFIEDRSGTMEILGYFDFVILGVLVLAASYFLFINMKEKRLDKLLFGIFPVLSVIVYVIINICNKPIVRWTPDIYNYTSATASIGAWTFSFYTLFLGVVLMYSGMTRHNLEKANLGLFALAILTFTKFMDMEVDFITKGVVFIIIGTAFLLANYLISRGIRRGGNNEV